MDYQKIYNQITERAKYRILDCYKERHHVIPKCMGGDNNKENLVELTAKEHFLCHLILCKIYPENNKLIIALWLMAIGRSKMIKYKVSSRLYEELKIKHSNIIKGNNSIIGKKIIQYNLNGELVKIWNNLTEVNKVLGISTGDLSCVCRKKQNTAGGFQWKYYEENYSYDIPSISMYKKPKNKYTGEKLRGKKRTKEQIKHRYSPILQYDLVGNFIKEYEFIREASRELKISESTIGMCLNNKKGQKSAGGFQWKYKISDIFLKNIGSIIKSKII